MLVYCKAFLVWVGRRQCRWRHFYLVPRQRESGQYQGKVMLSKRGNSKLRALLYFPAMNACRFNPDIKAQHERLLSCGKVKMQTIGAAMRKLVHICFGVLKHQVVYQSRASVI